MEKEKIRSRLLSAFGLIALTLLGAFAQVEFEKMNLNANAIFILRMLPFATMVALAAFWIYKELKWKLNALIEEQWRKINEQFSITRHAFNAVDDRFKVSDLQISILAAQSAYRLQRRVIFQDDGSIYVDATKRMSWSDFLKIEILFVRGHLQGMHAELTNIQIEGVLKAVYKENYIL